MASRHIRVGYVGAGWLAQRVHLPNFASLPNCELAALAEVRTDLGEKVQRRHGIPRLYRDHRELAADPEIDAVAVSGAFAVQGEIARDCLAAGKHVFMEKPMAILVAQAEDEAGQRVRVRHADLDKDGHTGVVVLDVDGVRATLETGSLRYHRWDEHTQVYFQRGWVHTWAPPLLLRNTVAEVEVYRSDEAGVPGTLGEAGVQHTLTRPLPEPRWSWSYRREVEHFVECLRTGAPFRSSGEDTLNDVRLFEEIFRTWLNR